MSDAETTDLIELLIVLDPPQTRDDADREAYAIVRVLSRAGYDARVTDLRGADE